MSNMFFFFLTSLLFVASFLGGYLIPAFVNRKSNCISNLFDEELDTWKQGNYSFPKSKNVELRLATIRHLMIDFNNIEKEMFENKESLLLSMTKLVGKINLKLLSVHCHTLKETGEVCIGLLQEGHISLRTWSEFGVCSLNILTDDTKPVITIIQEFAYLFTSNQMIEPDQVISRSYRWAYKERGRTRSEFNSRTDPILNGFLLKRKIASLENKHRQMDVFGNVYHRDSSAFRHNLIDDDSYEASHEEMFKPNRLIYLDQVLQSSRLAYKAHHESLVHPGMFAHEEPENIAIIGSNPGTLREVLKHKSVEKVTMLDVERRMIEYSREHLSSWGNCSDIKNSAPFCFDDSRVELIYDDGVEWLQEEMTLTDSDEEKFDVIICDAHDYGVLLSESLYTDELFFTLLFQALSTNGIIIMKLEKSQVAGMHSENLDRVTSFLEEIGIESFHPYENGLSDPWSYLVACKTKECRYNWQSNSAFIEVAIHDRVNTLNSGDSPFSFFDGSTMKSFQVPHKSFEKDYCRRDPVPVDCQVLSSYTNYINVPSSSFDVRQSTLGKNAGRGVFSAKNITKGSLIALEMVPNTIRIYPYSKDIVDIYVYLMEEMTELYAVYAYMYGYGFSVQFYNGDAYFVDGSIMTYVNHGCNSTNNLGDFQEEINPTNYSLSEQFVLPETFGDILEDENHYNPLFLRHIEFMNSALDYASKDIFTGEELFQNYLTYESTQESFLQVANNLKSVCAGIEAGEVTRYETGKKMYHSA